MPKSRQFKNCDNKKTSFNLENEKDQENHAPKLQQVILFGYDHN